MARAIASYIPVLVPTKRWRSIEDFVRAAVTDCDARTRYRAQVLLSVFALHTDWCHYVAGLPLDRAVILHRDVIAEYTERGITGKSAGTAGNYRSQLLRMAEVLVPEQTPSRLAPLPPSNPTAPYRAADVISLWNWAAGQPTQYRRLDCTVLLACGLGAGLAAGEVLELRAKDVIADSEGVVLRVTGTRPRVVPVLARAEGQLLDASRYRRPEDFMFRPGRVTSGRNTVSNFLAKTTDERVHVETQRLRATWVVTHLAARTPLKALMLAAGTTSLTGLNRYLESLPEDKGPATRQSLRYAGGDW